MEIVRLLKKDKKRFAKAVGVDVSTVYRWLSGVSSPNFEELMAIKRVTSDDANDLMNFFCDLSSSCDRALKCKSEAKDYINGVKSLRMWRGVFK